MAVSIQKANFWKRISASLFDLIITIMLAVGLAAVLSVAFRYDDTSAKLNEYYIEYEVKYGVDFDVTQEQFDQLTQEEQENYRDAEKAFTADLRVLKIYQKAFFLSLLIVSIALLLTVVVVQFIVPLFFKNGQTLGKKIFGVGLTRTNLVQISKFVLFVRAVFGVYAIETMFPVALILAVYFGMMGSAAAITILLLLALQIGVLVGTKHHAAIHDLLADTAVVDIASQRIFATQEELLAFQQAEHAAEVAKKDYI